jgi:hypothetical protein
MLDLIAQLGIGIFGPAAFICSMSEQRKWKIIGVVLGWVSQPFWYMMLVLTEYWYTTPVHVAYTIGWVLRTYNLSVNKDKKI